MKSNPQQFKPYILYITFLILVFTLTACPAPENGDIESDPDIYLEIPPPGTEFIYVESLVAWEFQSHPRVMAGSGRNQQSEHFINTMLGQNLLDLADSSKIRMDSDPDYHEAVAPVALAWGYIITGDEEYLESVRNSLEWLLDFPRLVKYPEGDNIAFLQQAMALGGVYDLLYDEFNEDERTEIETVLRETVFHTLAYKVTEYDKEINFWANDPDTNYFLIFHSTAGLVSIILTDIEPDAAELAGHCWERVRESMDAFADENGWREGLTYLDFCWGQSALYFLLAVEGNSDLKPFDESWFDASVRWAWWGALPDRETIACFGDNEPENYSVGSYLFRAGILSVNEDYLWEADATSQVREMALDLPLFAAMCLGRPASVLTDDGDSITDQEIYAEFYPDLEWYISNLSDDPGWNKGITTEYFPGIEWGFIRAGSADPGLNIEDDFYLAFKSGVSGYDHNHLDQGSMILAAYSEILLSDPGRGGPDIIRQDPYINCLFESGLGHNTLIFDDGCYMDLDLFPDNPDYFSDKGSITSYFENNAIIQYTTENSGLYPTEPLDTYRRTFLYIKPGVIDDYDLGALVIADRVLLTTEKNHSFLFHTPGEVELIETGVAKLINNGARLDYFGFCTIPTIDNAERQETSMESRDSTCYFRTIDTLSAGSDWIHVLVPKRVDDPDSPRPEFTMHPLGITVRWDDHVIDFIVRRNLGWVVEIEWPVVISN